MGKGRRKLKPCGRIMTAVILLSLLILFPVSGEPWTAQAPISSEGETRRYGDLEIDLLIDELSIAAKEAIEKAAAEAAKAAALASIEREAVLLQEKAAATREAQRWRSEAETAKKNMGKAGLLAGIIGLLGGLTIGIGGTMLMSR